MLLVCCNCQSWSSTMATMAMGALKGELLASDMPILGGTGGHSGAGAGPVVTCCPKLHVRLLALLLHRHFSLPALLLHRHFSRHRVNLLPTLYPYHGERGRTSPFSTEPPEAAWLPWDATVTVWLLLYFCTVTPFWLGFECIVPAILDRTYVIISVCGEDLHFGTLLIPPQLAWLLSLHPRLLKMWRCGIHCLGCGIPETLWNQCHCELRMWLPQEKKPASLRGLTCSPRFVSEAIWSGRGMCRGAELVIYLPIWWIQDIINPKFSEGHAEECWGMLLSLLLKNICYSGKRRVH